MRRIPLTLLLLTVLVRPAAASQESALDPQGSPLAAERYEAAAASGQAAARLAAVASLNAQLERVLRVPGWRGDAWSVLVVSLDDGDTIYARTPELALAPASNMKLFTTAAALYYLGPDFRYTTFLLGTGPVEDGVLRGDLVLYGTGDPTLTTRDMGIWNTFADSLAALGVREIEGALLADASYFGGPGNGTGWRASYMNAAYAASAGALSFNENLVTVQVRPGSAPGRPPAVTIIPGGEGIGILNQATTVASGQTQIRVSRTAYDGTLLITGQIAADHRGLSQVVPVGEPALYTAAVLRQVLERRGIQVKGGLRELLGEEASPLTGRSVFAPAFDESPAIRLIALHQSAPLLDILEVINKRSHNLYAEQVLRTVGRAVLGEGTAEAGARATLYFLECETGATALALEMLDGSGLSPLNRVSASTLVQLLSYMADSPFWTDYWYTLPESGQRDGLRRMLRTPAEGNLRAKTGTIDRVSSLSGYVRAANGERLAFAIVSNEVPSTWRAKRVEDDIGALLAGFVRPSFEAAPATTGF